MTPIEKFLQKKYEELEAWEGKKRQVNEDWARVSHVVSVATYVKLIEECDKNIDRLDRDILKLAVAHTEMQDQETERVKTDDLFWKRLDIAAQLAKQENPTWDKRKVADFLRDTAIRHKPPGKLANYSVEYIMKHLKTGWRRGAPRKSK